MSNDALMAEVLAAVKKLNFLIERDPLDLVTEAEKRGWGKIRTYEIEAQQTEEITEKATYLHIAAHAPINRYKSQGGDWAKIWVNGSPDYLRFPDCPDEIDTTWPVGLPMACFDEIGHTLDLEGPIYHVKVENLTPPGYAATIRVTMSDSIKLTSKMFAPHDNNGAYLSFIKDVDAAVDNMAIILVSHKLEDVVELCDQAYVLRRVKLVGEAEVPCPIPKLIDMCPPRPSSCPPRERGLRAESPQCSLSSSDWRSLPDGFPVPVCSLRE